MLKTSGTLLIALVLLAPARGANGAPGAASGGGGGGDGVQQPVKTLVQAVRYGKDDMALGLLAGEAQGRVLLGEDWAKASAADRTEFVRLFHALFAAIAFPRIRQTFDKLETVLYDPPAVQGTSAAVASTIVILHPMKKQELKATYDLTREAGGWKVVDVTVAGDRSMLTNIRADQIVPLMKEGGLAHVLALMRERLKEVRGG
jgi:phospholipid transport system substrate-binding protein